MRGSLSNRCRQIMLQTVGAFPFPGEPAQEEGQEEEGYTDCSRSKDGRFFHPSSNHLTTEEVC